MRTRAVWFMAAFLVGFVVLGPTHAQPGTNLLLNGGFETGAIGPYGTYGTCTTEVITNCVGAAVPERPVEGKYCLHIVVPTPAAGSNNWDVGMTDGSHSFQQGKKYTFSCFMKCKSGTLQVRMKPERGADPWEAYNELVATVTDTWQEFSVTTPVIAATVTPASPTFHFNFAAGDFWMDGVRLYEGDYVKPDFLKVFSADEPAPQDGATDVPQDVVLSWEPGPFAVKHNVFFGTDFDDVNDATAATAGVETSMGQAGTTFDPAGLLEFGRTYYWRVDEVNAPPDSSVFKGNVWSFTAEPFVYAISNITATASSSEKAANGPQNTVNGSGLDAADLHSTASTAMWLSSMTGPQPAWIQYQFDQVYKLDALWVWNYNVEFEPVLGYGFKDVTIEYSLDGETWTTLSDVQFAQATAQSGYAHNTTVELGGVLARYVRLTANSNWSLVGLKQYGLSEVRFYYVPVQAREPGPAAGAEGVALDPTLTWRPGREAVSHKVYFSADRQAVADGTAPATTVDVTRYQPGGLDYGQNYYWRVDELGAADGAVYPGQVWSFSSTEFFVVDDFESYNDEEGQNTRIYENWIDGYADNSSGSTVGNLQPPFAEQGIVHSGAQSMPMDYNNVHAPYFSEAYREFTPLQNWTVKGVTDLILWVQGYPAAMAPVVETAGKLTVTGAGTDIWNNGDEFTYVYKTLNGDGVLTARVVSKGTGSNVWAKGGVMIRDSLDAGSAHAMMVLTDNSDGTGGNGASFQWRATPDGASSNSDATTTLNAPYYVKIERKGDSLSGAVSPDGTNWTALGTPQFILMANPVYLGLCVTSHAAGENRTMTFDNVKATGASGAWQTKEIGLARNSVQNLYVMVQDSTGQSATVSQADLVTTAQWTEWRIPLSRFAGVNLAKVQRMYLGVGDRQNPQPDGAGKIYIDDIRVGRRGSSDPGTSGLEASYALENDATDGSGNGHDGTVMGTPAYVAGAVGQALQFNGAGGQYVQCGTWNPSAATGQLSVALWAKWAGLSGFYQGLAAKRDTWAVNDMMWQVEANIDTGAVTFSRTDVYPASGNPVLPAGEWTHVTVTFDGTTAKFFVNAALTGQGAFSFGTDPAAGVHFGCCDSNGGNPFNGALDEVRIYNRPLSSFEINYLAGQ
jgi:hypothetical protein